MLSFTTFVHDPLPFASSERYARRSVSKPPSPETVYVVDATVDALDYGKFELQPNGSEMDLQERTGICEMISLIPGL